MQNDAELTRRLKAGEKAAFEELLDGYGARVQNLALRYSRSPADAEDLTQEIFVAIFKSISSFRGDSELATWLTRIAFNHCLRWKEKDDKEQGGREPNPTSTELELPCPDPGNDPARRHGRIELSSQVQTAVSQLSDMHREVVTLHELHGLSYAQCSEVLQVPIGTVKSRLSNAFSQLRRTLRPYVMNEEGSVSPMPLAPEGAGGTP
ncbi:RNA polymerase sigma factor [bacterium]|nr:MAG: RNA polymerase sigma factor [bacterium]